MRALGPYVFTPAKYTERVTGMREDIDWIKLARTTKTPQAPRDLRAQSGSRGALITWRLPEVNDNIAGWRLFIGAETGRMIAVNDKGIRQAFVELTAGTTPPPTNVFVCSVNASGQESIKALVQATATVEAGAPATPAPPPEYGDEGSGGGGSQGGGRSKFGGFVGL